MKSRVRPLLAALLMATIVAVAAATGTARERLPFEARHNRHLRSLFHHAWHARGSHRGFGFVQQHEQLRRSTSGDVPTQSTHTPALPEGPAEPMDPLAEDHKEQEERDPSSDTVPAEQSRGPEMRLPQSPNRIENLINNYNRVIDGQKIGTVSVLGTPDGDQISWLDRALNVGTEPETPDPVPASEHFAMYIPATVNLYFDQWGYPNTYADLWSAANSSPPQCVRFGSCVDFKKWKYIEFIASGSVSYRKLGGEGHEDDAHYSSNTIGPTGDPTTLLKGLPAYSLIGIWSTDQYKLEPYEQARSPFALGEHGRLTVPANAPQAYLFLGFNDDDFTDNVGVFKVTFFVKYKVSDEEQGTVVPVTNV